MTSASTQDNAYSFLQGGGEAGELVLQYDWSKTSLGAIEEWPLSLKVTLGNILHSGFPMLLFWGDDLTCFYNDAFRPSLGNEGRHPGIGRKGRDIWQDVWDFTGPLLQGVIQTGKQVFFEDQLVPFFRDGKTENIYWTFSYSPAYNDEGVIGGVLVTCMETTSSVVSRKKIEAVVASRTAELKTANDSLLQANEYLQNIINGFTEPLQVLEPIIENDNVIDFRYKITNDAYAAYADTTPKQLTGKKVGDVFPGYFETSSFINVAETFITGESNTWDIHYEVDGLNLYNRMSARRVEDEVVVHFTDFTEVRNLQHELEVKIEQLERSNQQLEEFAYAASHDLKEPIRKIKIFTEQLKNLLLEHLTESELHLLGKVQNSTQRMNSLVDDLLQFSHLNERNNEKESLDLNETVEQVLEDLELDITQKAATISTNGLTKVSGHKRQLQQMFQNLISNGLKYSKSNVAPIINISSALAEENGRQYHLIEVQDNGIGFEQEHEDSIFKMFVRLHRRDEYSGTGIGLSIVKKVIDNHDGIIKVQSTSNVGSTFKVYLPVE